MVISQLLVFCMYFQRASSLIFTKGNHSAFDKYEYLNYDPTANKRAVEHYLERMKIDTENHHPLNIKIETIQKTFHLVLESDSKKQLNSIDSLLYVRSFSQGDTVHTVKGSILGGVFHGSIKINKTLSYHFEDIKYHFEEAKNNDSYLIYHTVMYMNHDLTNEYMNNYKCNSTNLRSENGIKSRRKSRKSNQIKWRAKRMKNRIIRQTSGNNGTICTIEMTLHDTFIKRFSSAIAAVASVMHIVDEANDIFMKDAIIKGAIQYKIAKIVLAQGRNDFLLSSYQDSSKILTDLRQRTVGDFCIRGAMVHHSWGAVLGLATLRGPSDSVCSKTAVFTVSTMIGTVTMPLPHVIAVLTHELGHTLAMRHDPSPECPTSSCEPIEKTDCMTQTFGNGYLMSFAVNTGIFSNNLKFSTCSSTSTKYLLERSNKDCLKSQNDKICGNGIVENGEACDPGIFDQSPCCNSTCQLITGKECCPSKGLCCDQNCKFINNTACHNGDECSGSSTCNGSSAVCPPGTPKNNDTACNNGRSLCFNGKCSKSICDNGTENQSCTCAVDKQCVICCSSKIENGTNKNCSPLKNDAFYHSVGFPCNNGSGYCDHDGNCTTYHGDSTVSKIWEYFSKPSFWIDLYQKVDKYQFGIAATFIVMLISGVTKLFSIDYGNKAKKLQKQFRMNAR